MTKLKITEEQLEQLEYDTNEMSEKNTVRVIAADNTGVTGVSRAGQNGASTVMFVFDGGDLNAAAYHLAKSLEDPYATRAVATLLLQESIASNFTAILVTKLKSFNKDFLNSCTGFAHALQVIERLKVKTVTGIDAEPGKSPTLAHGLTHDAFDLTATGIVTMHIFRTVKESLTLCNKETGLSFENASIWHQDHSSAYEIIAGLSIPNFFVNCFDVPLKCLEEDAKKSASHSCVVMDKSYHYETLKHNNQQKSIVFPIGTIFAN